MGDNASLVSQYDGLVQTNLNWFFSDNTAKQTYTDIVGNTAYNWGFFAGLVDGTNGTGHKAPTTYGRNANLFLADLRPDKYYDLVSPELTSGGMTTSMDTFSRFIWAKSQRQTEGYSIGFSPAPGPSTAAQNCHAVDVHERGIDSLHHRWQQTVCNNRHALYRSGHG